MKAYRVFYKYNSDKLFIGEIEDVVILAKKFATENSPITHINFEGEIENAGD